MAAAEPPGRPRGASRGQAAGQRPPSRVLTSTARPSAPRRAAGGEAAPPHRPRRAAGGERAGPEATAEPPGRPRGAGRGQAAGTSPPSPAPRALKALTRRSPTPTAPRVRGRGDRRGTQPPPNTQADPMGQPRSGCRATPYQPSATRHDCPPKAQRRGISACPRHGNTPTQPQGHRRGASGASGHRQASRQPSQGKPRPGCRGEPLQPRTAGTKCPI